jgi:molybdopterin-containing oxidoreductase family iron-sulfur binding subunit
MAGIGRRDFLKIVGSVGSATLMSCSLDETRRLIPYVIPPRDILPGKATWYATTCRECPAGCGMWAKNMDGRAIKVEGNPIHPVNQGSLCARGQASLQGLYNPDRIREPLMRHNGGGFNAVSWEEAERTLGERLKRILEEGRGERLVFVTELINGTLGELIRSWLGSLGSIEHILYEPIAYEALREANSIVCGIDGIPTYLIEDADLIISFGADFLETWLSPVSYSRRFAIFRRPIQDGLNLFVYVGPRLSLTAANADEWLAVRPGEEHIVALSLLKAVLEAGYRLDISSDERDSLMGQLSGLDLEAVADRTGLPPERIRALARLFGEASSPLVLAGGLSASTPHGTETAVASNLLCMLKEGSRSLLDFGRISALSEAARVDDMRFLLERMQRNDIDVLILYNVNPVFTLPAEMGFAEALGKVPFVVSMASSMDETSEMAHLIVPVHTPLESWGDYSPDGSAVGLMQPVMGPMFSSRHIGDILLSLARRLGLEQQLPWERFYQLLRETWRKRAQKHAGGQEGPETFWESSVRRGGLWEIKEKRSPPPFWRIPEIKISWPASGQRPKTSLRLTIYPTIEFFDGRGANRPWLQELPDPITQVTWGGWVEIHPQTARRMGLEKGDLVRIVSANGEMEVPVYPYVGLHPDCVAVPLGQGHTRYGRFADVPSGNPARLVAARMDSGRGGPVWSAVEISLEKVGKKVPLAHTDGSLLQHGRALVQTVSIEKYRDDLRRGIVPRLRMPLPEGYRTEEDFYPPHTHPDYRWAMVVDLDRCTGCGACVVACYAENNVAIVGRKLILEQREMSWIRVQRYLEPKVPAVRFLVMLCQHCDNAPCEPVCPVYAPHHNIEGLNVQVYNRCIGTRFCSQNCPYKVRRFNWFTFTREEPLNWQLNPDVTVRQKGVMEKCSFCVQRIVEARHRAGAEGRKVRDGDVVPACAQTCPTEALVFGNLLEPESRVSRLSRDPRAYQIFEHLNTKPAVIYLKKVIRRSGGITNGWDHLQRD